MLHSLWETGLQDKFPEENHEGGHEGAVDATFFAPATDAPAVEHVESTESFFKPVPAFSELGEVHPEEAHTFVVEPAHAFTEPVQTYVESAHSFFLPAAEEHVEEEAAAVVPAPAETQEAALGPRLVTEPVAEKEPEAVTISSDEFSALEERILRAVNMVKRERLARTEAEERAATVEAQLREEQEQTQRIQAELQTLRGERDQVRQRVEHLLSQLDAREL